MKRLLYLLSILFLVSCARQVKNEVTPADDASVVEEVEESVDELFKGEHQVTEDFNIVRPRKIAILPFINKTDSDEAFDIVRKSFYNHFSSRNYTDMELYKVDKLLRDKGLFKPEEINQAKAEELGEILAVDAVIYGTITKFDRLYAVLYSQVAVGVELKMVGCSEGKLLWRASDVSRKHEGGVSITPWGIAIDAAQTALNMRKIQLLRAADDLFRDILETLPELEIADAVHPPRIDSLVHDSSGAVRGKGDIIKVALYGEPGRTAFFDLGELKKKIPMIEETDGIYQGSYQVLEGDNVQDATVTGYLVDNSGNRSSRNDVLGPVTIDTKAPDAPLDILARGFDRDVVLKWKPNQEKDLARYTVYRSSTPLTGYEKIGDTELISYRDKGLQNMTRYYYKISAADRSGNEGPMSEMSEGMPIAPGPTVVEGPIREDAVWYAGASPYRITGDLVVEKGATLTLEAGTVVEVSGAQVRVRGKLLSHGSPENLIVFTGSSDPPSHNSWKGIFFDNTGTTKSVLEHTKIEYAEVGVKLDASSPVIKECNFSKNQVGIYVSGALSKPVIIKNSITANVNTGIHLTDAASPSLGGNSITANLSHGILSENSSPKIVQNTITNNAHSGLRLISSAKAELVENIFADNGWEDMFIDNKNRPDEDIAPTQGEADVITLFDAAQTGDTGAIKGLLDSDADVNKEFSDNWTALMAAAVAGHAQAVEMLIDQGAYVNVKGKYGNTSLILAAAAGHTETVKILLDKGAEVQAKTKRGFTPLLVAAAAGHINVVKALLENDAYVNVKEEYGNSPLILAAAAGHKKIVQVLIKNGADVNYKGPKGITKPKVKTTPTGTKAKNKKTDRAKKPKQKTDKIKKFKDEIKTMEDKFTDEWKIKKF